MDRKPRFPGRPGIYSVLLTINARRRLFLHASDQPSLEAILARALERNQARLHAFAWLERQASLVIQAGQVPIGSIVQFAEGPYSKWVNRRHGLRGHHFGRSYQAILLTEAERLPELIRHVHLSPIGAGLVADPADYPGTSHRAYLGLMRVPWLTTAVVLQQLELRGWPQRDGYARFIAEGDGPDIVAERAVTGRMSAFRTVDDESFYGWLKQVQEQRPSLQQIVEAVCRLLEIEPADLRGSKRPALPLARALITWYATHGAAITLAAVAKHLDRHSATLLASVRRHRALRPRLFEMSLEQLLGRSDPR